MHMILDIHVISQVYACITFLEKIYNILIDANGYWIPDAGGRDSD